MPKLKSDGFGRSEAPTHGSRKRTARPARHAEGVGPMETGQAFTTRIDSRNDVISIALGGELDMATVPMLAEQLTAVERDGAKVIMLDLRGLRFVDSSGLHEFVRAHKRSLLNGHRLVLVGANPSARQLANAGSRTDGKMRRRQWECSHAGRAPVLRRTGFACPCPYSRKSADSLAGTLHAPCACRG